MNYEEALANYRKRVGDQYAFDPDPRTGYLTDLEMQGFGAGWRACEKELQKQLTRRDAAFAALVKHVRIEYEMHEGVLPCPPDSTCDNRGCPCEHWIARHTQMQSDCREALKLAEGVEG